MLMNGVQTHLMPLQGSFLQAGFSDLTRAETPMLVFLQREAGTKATHLTVNTTQGTNTQGYHRTKYGISSSVCLTCMCHGMNVAC